MSQQSFLLLAAFLLVLLNGFFVAAEFALVKMRATRIQELADQGHWRARVAKGVIGHLDAYLSATQLGITIASIGLGWIGEPAVAHLIEPLFQWIGIQSEAAIKGTSFGVAFAIVAFVHIVLGELAPKSLAIRMPEATSLWTAVPLRVFYVVMYPAIVVLNGAANAVLRAVGLSLTSEANSAHSTRELRMLVAASHAHGELNAVETKLVENVIDFSERSVAEIMTPRLKMVCLFTDKTLGENIAIVREHQFTRFPLADRDVDHIIGVIHIKDLLLMQGVPKGEGGLLRSLKRSVAFVPETATIDVLLREIQRRRTLMTIVIDEQGTVAGLVTLEDVLEEIVGPIRDEFDSQEAPELVQQGDDIILDGGLPLVQAAKVLKDFEGTRDQRVNTIGGQVLKLLGHVPVVGETLTAGPYEVQVMEMDNFRIARLRFRKRDQADDGGANQSE